MRSADEKTEEMLTDYLDGTLDAGKRAELEAYLAANPLEREALEMLRGQRDMLRALPRERVPDDLGEQVTGPLERSALLEGLDEAQGRSAKAAPWRSRMLPVAAALLVSSGVLYLIYSVVNPPRSDHGGVALSPPSSPAEGSAREQANGVAGPLAESVTSKMKAAARDLALEDKDRLEASGFDRSPATRPLASRFLPARGGGAPAPLARSVPAGPLADAMPAAIAPAKPEVSHPRLVRIYADEPSVARGRVEEFLRKGGWSVTPALKASGEEGVAKGATTAPVLGEARKAEAGSGASEGRGFMRFGLPETRASGGGGGNVGRPDIESLSVRVEADQADILAAVLPNIASPTSTLTPATLPTITPPSTPSTQPADPMPLVTLRVEILPIPKPATLPSTQP